MSATDCGTELGACSRANTTQSHRVNLNVAESTHTAHCRCFLSGIANELLVCVELLVSLVYVTVTHTPSLN